MRPRTASKKQPTKHTHKKPRSLEDYSQLPARSQETWNSAAHVISKMRAEGLSLHQSCREFGIDPRTVTRWAGSALRKGSNGRYAAKRSDKLLRVLAVPTRKGLREVAVNDSRQATQLAKYWDAVQKYLRTGDASALKKLRGVRITDANGKLVPLVRSLSELDRLGSAGVLSFESLYARTA